MKNGKPETNLMKGLVAGMVGGIVASCVMNQFQAMWTRKKEGFDKPHGAQSGQPSEGENASPRPQPEKGEQDDATVRTAKLISKNVFGHELRHDEERSAGAVVHYVFGTATGALYGAAAEVAPQITAAGGLPFGAAFWVVADETVVPLLGLSKGPSGYRLPTHLYAFASHLVYGVTAEATRRATRAILD